MPSQDQGSSASSQLCLQSISSTPPGTPALRLVCSRKVACTMMSETAGPNLTATGQPPSFSFLVLRGKTLSKPPEDPPPCRTSWQAGFPGLPQGGLALLQSDVIQLPLKTTLALTEVRKGKKQEVAVSQGGIPQRGGFPHPSTAAHLQASAHAVPPTLTTLPLCRSDGLLFIPETLFRYPLLWKAFLASPPGSHPLLGYAVCAL